MTEKEERTERDPAENPGDSIAAFIEQRRGTIIAGAAAVVVIVLGFAAALGIRESLAKRGISRVEALMERYDTLHPVIADPEQAEAAEQLLADIAEETKRSFGYAAARAWYLLASVQADLGTWDQAEESWILAAKKAGKSYLAPAALFNAGAAAEERENFDGAIAHYSGASSRTDFPQAARALFAVGRLEEGRDNTGEAIETYRQVMEKWPSTSWANLAQSRIIALGMVPD